jgi:hypothetical protein
MPVRTTRFAVSDMAVSGEPSVNDPPWKYRIVPGRPACSDSTRTPGRPPRVTGLERTCSGTRIIAISAANPGPHLRNRARTARDRTPHHGVHPHALLSAHQLPLSPGNSGHAVRAKNGLDPSDGRWL